MVGFLSPGNRWHAWPNALMVKPSVPLFLSAIGGVAWLFAYFERSCCRSFFAIHFVDCIEPETVVAAYLEAWYFAPPYQPV